ncbi:PQQ-dependent dehydrogenase, methanol/ethanol family [Marinobacter segnicrescens]|uniref:PQQ-dependent dehydrogenase, methanol/ethanol family n=1 Tax=Marinobacter segnicrescens TaxID=430453 RepID=UPI003A8ECF1E
MIKKQSITLLSGCLLGAIVASHAMADDAKYVDDNHRAIAENRETGKNWPAHGFDYWEQRYSPLAQINTDNVKDLKLEWTYNLQSTRGVESTPVVVDEVMYVTAPWSIVHAVDAKTGKNLWTYDPKVPKSYGEKGCCDVGNRGVAVSGDRVYFGAFDGRLIALDAASGEVVWEVDTIEDREKPYTITGAPRVFKGKVIIGNGGAEYGVRGYITAYDAETGEEAWRWYTVPGNPDEPFENEAMEMAAKTWDPSAKYWENGGGGTVWDSIVFDPELDLMYIGTGNGTPWSHHHRSPAGGDNLFLASIVALDPDTGEYQWHYQETPADNWDYTSTQDIILADLPVDGETRKVLLHAPKNGFFYVVDRKTGEFLSAENFVDVNWATGYDESGRPIENPEARSTDEPYDSIPGPYGAHNWHSMSYSPDTRLAYIPAQNIPVALQDMPEWTYNSDEPGVFQGSTGWNTGMYLNPTAPGSEPFGRLVAWDPVIQEEAWRHDHISPWNGGTMTTAGNLVFQGTADARLMAFNAQTGEQLWDTLVGTGIVAAPVTYEVDGKQFVSIAAGWGGAYGLVQRATERTIPGTVYTYSLTGTAEAPAHSENQRTSLVSGVEYDPELAEEGTALFITNCVVCHGVPGVDRGGALPNLGYSSPEVIRNLESFVLEGALASRGMPDFSDRLTQEDVDKIRAFIMGTADTIRASQ